MPPAENQNSEFGVVMLTELIVAIMSDGRWYSATYLRKRIRPSTRGVITGTVDRLRRLGYVRRAKNPAYTGRPQHRITDAEFVYQWTGRPWEWKPTQLRPGAGEGIVRWVRYHKLPKKVRDLLA